MTSYEVDKQIERSNIDYYIERTGETFSVHITEPSLAYFFPFAIADGRGGCFVDAPMIISAIRSAEQQDLEIPQIVEDIYTKLMQAILDAAESK